jgi:hypothetical protein
MLHVPKATPLPDGRIGAALKTTPQEVNRLTNVQHTSRIDGIAAALKAPGKRLDMRTVGYRFAKMLTWGQPPSAVRRPRGIGPLVFAFFRRAPRGIGAPIEHHTAGGQPPHQCPEARQLSHHTVVEKEGRTALNLTATSGLRRAN